MMQLNGRLHNNYKLGVHMLSSTKRFTTIIYAGLILATSISQTLSAEETIYNWSGSIGFVKLSPNDSSSEISGPGLPPGTGITVGEESSWVGSIEYHQTANISYQLFIGPKYSFDIDAGGSIAGLGNLGTIDAFLLPTVLANYTFGDTSAKFRPFVGLGVNRTEYSTNKINPTTPATLGGPTTLSIEDSTGFIAQIGFHYNFTPNLFITASYARLNAETTITLNTPNVGTSRKVDVVADPTIIYLTLGYRF
jgi:outer membrane protein